MIQLVDFHEKELAQVYKCTLVYVESGFRGGDICFFGEGVREKLQVDDVHLCTPMYTRTPGGTEDGRRRTEKA